MRCGSFKCSTCARCQAIASPSRSGSDASRMFDAPLAAAFNSLIVDSFPGMVTYSGLNECSMSMPSVLFGRSRTWPIEARMSYLPPRKRPSVFAFAGDSTMISGFAISVLSAARDRTAVADYIAANFQQRQAPIHFFDVQVHHDRQVIMMARFYPIKQFPNGHQLIKDGATLVQTVEDVLDEFPALARVHARARAHTRARTRARADSGP